MFDYRGLLCQIAPITDVDLMFLNISPETRVNVARQYNKALSNAQGEGTDVAQIFLKPLIVNYPDWGDPALVFGLCLARDYEFRRAGESVEYSIKKILTTQNNLYVAQEGLKQIRDSITRGDKRPAPVSENNRKGSGNSNRGMGGASMQAPILMRASHGSEDFKMASDKERREVMMRSAASGDEQINDDIEIESMRTPADKMRTTINIIVGVLLVAALALIIYFVVIPSAALLKTAKSNQDRLDFLVNELGEYKNDPEVNAVLQKYLTEFATEENTSANASETTPAETAGDTQITTQEPVAQEAEATAVTLSPEEVAALNGEAGGEGAGEVIETMADGSEVTDANEAGNSDNGEGTAGPEGETPSET